MILALFLIACPEPEETGDSTPVEDTEIPESRVCDPAVVKFDGEDPPKVGDLWSFWLTCDGAIEMGVTRPSVEPAEAGEITEGASTPEITWKQEGEAILHIQTGRFEGEIAVTVAPAGS